jgi:hypothetical protein
MQTLHRETFFLSSPDLMVSETGTWNWEFSSMVESQKLSVGP